MGASSGIGLAATKRALSQGHDVVAFARSAGEMSLTHGRLSKVPGDARSGEDVKRALDGVDAVIQALGVSANVCVC